MTYFRDTDVAGRMAAKSEPELNTGCVLWSGVVNNHGYGKISIKGRKQFAHRLAFTLAIGPIPPDQCVCHRCDTPACVNPAHLFLGSQTENLADMNAKGRQVALAGEMHARAKLTEADVRVIKRRLLGGERTASIAADFAITRTAIWAIREGKRWAHVVGAVQ